MRLPKNKLKKNKSHLGKAGKAQITAAKMEARVKAVTEKKSEMETVQSDVSKPQLTDEEKFAAKQERKKANAHKKAYKKRHGVMVTNGKARIV